MEGMASLTHTRNEVSSMGMTPWETISTYPSISASIAAVITVTGAYLTMRGSKRIDLRSAADAALYSSGPRIIEELQKQLASQRKEIDDLWDARRASYQLEQDCKRDLLAMTQEVRELRWQLHQAGVITIPPRKPEEDGTLE
jgi:uncharacterized coiled-coil protein SlyX